MECARIALDSDFLLSINELKIDVIQKIRESLGKCKLFVPEEVMEEIKRASLSKGKKGVSARIALLVMEKNKVKETKKTSGNADLALEELGKTGYMIATNDKELKKKVKENNGKVIFIRQKKMIEIE